ncbi:MAG: choice-of-anchor Q domain-containing protein [Solirubrobacterales bacterium]
MDAGVADQLAPLDLAGGPRVQGPARDIGAFEFLPVAPEADGGVRSLSIRPKRFRARRPGGSVAAGILKSKPPVGAEVTYAMAGSP